MQAGGIQCEKPSCSPVLETDWVAGARTGPWGFRAMKAWEVVLQNVTNLGQALSVRKLVKAETGGA